MSSAGRELHTAGPGDAPPAQRQASAALCAAPGPVGERLGWVLPREPHGRDLDDREPLRRPPLAGHASRPEHRRRRRRWREMRGGGLERLGRCEEGPREGARPGLPTCGGNGWPGEEQFQRIQKGRERVSSPSCLEIKDLLQNPEESPAKVSEKQSRLPKEAPGMKAERTGLLCNTRARAQARTGVLLEASQCSGGNGSFVSREPLSPASSEEEEEELAAFARQAEEGNFQNPGQEMNAVFNSRPSVQQEMFGSPRKHSLALALDACPPGMRLETTGQAFEGARMDLSEAAREVQEGGLKSSPSGGRMEDLGEASELQMAEAPLRAGSLWGEPSIVEREDSVAPFSSPVHKGTIDIQKGSAVRGCSEGAGGRFPSEHGRFLSPAEQLTGPKDGHSEIGCSSLCDVVRAAFEDELRVSSSEASSVQEASSSSLNHDRCITLGKGNGALLLERNNFASLQNSCSIKSVSAFLSCLAPQLNLGGDRLSLPVEPKDSLRTALLLCVLALPRCATSSFRVPEIGVCADEKSLNVPRLHGPSPLAQKAEPGSGHGGPMDSLSAEGVIVMRSTGAWLHHKEAFAPSQASGRLQAVMNDGAWEMVRWVLRGAENGEVAMEAFWRRALRFSDCTVNDLSSAPEEICALARNLFLDCKHLQRGRRGAATQISFSLGRSPALSEPSARFFSLQKCFRCSPYRNTWVALDRAGSPLDAGHLLEVPLPNLPKPEAENQRVDGSESILERKSNIFPPCGRVEAHKASGMKTIGNATVGNNTRLFFQLSFDGDLSQTFLLCRATFGKGQCLEEEETYQIHSSSPARHLSYLNKKGSSLCTKHSAQQRESIYQMKIFLYPCYFLDRCTLFEQKNDSPKTEFLECQQPSLIFYNELNHHDLQTVISSVIKYVRCNKNESLHSKMELKVTPPATALLTEYHQGPFQEIVESSNNNTGSEFTGNQLNKDFLESQSPRTLFRCSESTSELLNQNDFVKNRAQSKTDGLHFASESVHKSLSEKFDIINGLLSASKLVSSPFQTGLTASAKIKGQERLKGLLLKSYRKRKIPGLISAALGSQNKKRCLFPKEAALTSPSLTAESPPAQQHCRGALLPEREAGGRSQPFGLGRERLSSPPRRYVAAACPLTRKRTCQRFEGPSGAAPVSLYPLEQFLEAKQDLEAGPREESQTAGMAEGFPVHILSDTEESSEALLENAMLPFRGRKVRFSFKAVIHPGLPLGLPEGISEPDSREATDSPQPSVTWGHGESPNCMLQAKLFSPSMTAAETLCSSVPSSAGLKGGRFASSPTGPRMKEGCLLKVESGQELAGGSEKGLERRLVAERIGRGDSEAGPQPPPPKAKPHVGRRPATGQLPGNVSHENAAQPTSASLGRAGQKRGRQEPPFHTRSESKRQKTASLNLPFRNRSRQANRWPSSIGALGSFARAVGCHESRSTAIFGYLRLRRPFPAFRKVTCVKVGMPNRLRAPKPLASKGPSETFPGEKGQLVYSAQLAPEPAAPPAFLWDPPAKQQGHRSSSLASFCLTGQPKDAALLTRLSWLAEKLLALPCQPFPPRRVLLPSAAKWGPLRRRRRLLEIFSFVSLKLSSPPWLSSCCFKMTGSQALPVYSIESTILCFFELSSDSSCGSSTPVFPVSFHHQMDIGPTGKLPETGSPSLIPRFALGRPQPQQPPAWSLSSLLPQRCLDLTGPIQKDAEPGSTLASKEGEAVAHSTGCPTSGLPTALALFSPGCYRAWARRRRRQPSSRIPAVQRLSHLQFARGFKGFQCCPSVSADLFPPLPSWLHSVLSIWSQPGPSTHLSESTALHSGASKGQAALPATASLSHRSSLSLPPLVPGLPSDTCRAAKNDVRAPPAPMWRMTRLTVTVVTPAPEPGILEEEDSGSEGEDLARPPSPGPSSQVTSKVLEESQEQQLEAELSDSELLLSREERLLRDPKERRRLTREQQRKRLDSVLSVLLPASCQAPEPAHPPLGFPALESGNGDEASVPASPETGAQLEKDESENRPKKVSQIRIRKTIPKPDPNLTPMGLPRPKRLKKTEFSLEEIYTNQNYKSPPATRCLETIFEEPKEKNGSLISISQQKRKRILEFQDFTIPRKRRARSRVRVMGGYTRAQKAAIEGRELDGLLIQKLTDLETFFAKEETQEQASSGS